MGWKRAEMDIEKSPMGLAKWVVIFLFGGLIIFGSFNFITRYLSVNADRIITKSSFQYKEGMEQRGAILKANIEEIDIMLSQNPPNREELLAQKRVLSSQLRAITINK